jgi:hypothetical protein
MKGLIFLGRLDDSLEVLRPFRPGKRIALFVVAGDEALSSSFRSCLECCTLWAKPCLLRMLKKHSIRFDPRGVRGSVMELNLWMSCEPPSRCLIRVDVGLSTTRGVRGLGKPAAPHS